MFGAKRFRAGSESESCTDSDGENDNIWDWDAIDGVEAFSESEGVVSAPHPDEIICNVGYNPMLNPVILDGLFGACDLVDLKRFRLVCRLWRDVSLKRWRSKVNVTIEHPSDRYGTAKLNWANLRIFLKNVDLTESQQFRRFRLRNYEFSKKEYDEDDNITIFWATCGPFIHHLQIFKPVISCVESFYKIIVEKMPNLKSLTLVKIPGFTLKNSTDLENVGTNLNLEYLSINCGRGAVGCIPFGQLFRCFPNIKYLCLEPLVKQEFEDLIQALEKLNFNPTKGVPSLPRRKLNVYYKALAYEYLQDPDAINLKNFFRLPYISLVKLELELDSALDENFLSEMLDLHQSTLTTIDLRRDEDCVIPPPPRNPFVRVHPFLKNLHCRGQLVDNLHFLENTPNLTYLFFREIRLRNTLNMTNLEWMESRVKLASLKTLRVLYKPFCRGENLDFSVAEMRMIVNCMPNVTEYAGPMTNGTFRVVCEKWKGLKVLIIAPSTSPVDDRGITGIGTSGCDSEVATIPNITDLTYLYRFVMVNTVLSDLSVWNGFLKLEYLSVLEVKLSAETSNEAFSALFSKFPSVSVTRSSSGCFPKNELNQDLATKAAKLLKDFGIK